METKPATVNFPVDLIRCTAIVLIILVHTSGFPYQFYNPNISGIDIANWFGTNVYDAIGMLGLPLFVMLSGALLLTRDKADEPLRVFYKKRLDRIAVPFIFWTIVYFIFSFTVIGKPLSLYNVAQGLLGGSYYHLWYLYVLMGLYAVTPIMRVLVKHLNRRLFSYLLILWFAGTVITPFIHTFTTFNFNPVMFVFFDWIGYFLLGIYLLSAHFSRKTGITIAVLGLLGTVVGDWVVTGTAGQQFTGYFHNYMSATTIVASAAVFILLLSATPTRLQSQGKISRVMHWVSQNTMGIYLIHIIVLVALTYRVFGIFLNSLTYLPLIDVPIYTALVFVISAVLVFALKKIPYVKKLIG
jgi:surface polysaccharide O-acyltransferase-like enzyme